MPRVNQTGCIQIECVCVCVLQLSVLCVCVWHAAEYRFVLRMFYLASKTCDHLLRYTHYVTRTYVCMYYIILNALVSAASSNVKINQPLTKKTIHYTLDMH